MQLRAEWVIHLSPCPAGAPAPGCGRRGDGFHRGSCCALLPTSGLRNIFSPASHLRLRALLRGYQLIPFLFCPVLRSVLLLQMQSVIPGRPYLLRMQLLFVGTLLYEETWGILF